MAFCPAYAEGIIISAGPLRRRTAPSQLRAAWRPALLAMRAVLAALTFLLFAQQALAFDPVRHGAAHVQAGEVLRHAQVQPEEKRNRFERHVGAVVAEGAHEAVRIEHLDDAFAAHVLQDAGDAVTGPDGAVDEAVVFLVQLLEVERFLRHQAGQVAQAQRDAEEARGFLRRQPAAGHRQDVFLQRSVEFGIFLAHGQHYSASPRIFAPCALRSSLLLCTLSRPAASDAGGRPFRSPDFTLWRGESAPCRNAATDVSPIQYNAVM